ncbi:MAG: MBL fold metallo-hydrolase [Rhodospirillaceae bacterium]|nr:MBL fold metallo-hydrolase [Rhodospirillaceae bacterium]
MRVTMLGCGGSMGVPLIGNDWGNCDPTDPRNRRRRCSILVETARTRVLVDTSPDLREQLLETGTDTLDAVLYTHAHADHTGGLDDLRPLMFRNHNPLPAYMDAATQDSLETRFGYALSSVDVDRSFYRPIIEPRRLNGPLRIGDLEIVPFVQDHGPIESMGFRFGPFGYSTDVVALSDDAFAILEGVDTWVVDVTRERPHISHAHLDLALEWVERLKPRRTILTHMNHTLDYATLAAKLPPGVEPGQDGLVMEF